MKFQNFSKIMNLKKKNGEKKHFSLIFLKIFSWYDLTIPIKVSKVSNRYKVKTMSFTSQKYMLINVAVFITTQASNTLLQ